MDYLIQEFNLNIMKADHMFEMSLSKYNIKLKEFELLYESNVITEEEADIVKDEHKGSFLNNLAEFFEKIRKAIVDLVQKIITKIKNLIEEKKVRDKLKNIKIQLIKDKQKAGEKITIFDYNRYIKNYNIYITEYVRTIRKVRNTKFTTIKEYMSFIKSENDKLSNLELKLGLNKIEEFVLETSVRQAVDYTLEDSIKMLNDIAKIETESKLALDEAEKCAESNINEAADTNPNVEKVGFIKKISIKIANTTKTVVNNIPASVWNTISMISAATSAMAAVGAAKTLVFDKSDDKGKKVLQQAAISAGTNALSSYSANKAYEKQKRDQLKNNDN